MLREDGFLKAPARALGRNSRSPSPRRIHVIPRLRVGSEDIESRTKPARVIQTRSADAYEWQRGIDSSQKARTVVGAKTTRVRATSDARRGVVTR
jgi:hypothetical protein